jgi:plastocyanin
VVAGIALIASGIAWGYSQNKGSGGAGTAATGAARAVEVDLSEFRITPAMVMASVGDTLKVVNKGTASHQLTVEGTQLSTALIPPGGSATLSTSALSAGNYTRVLQRARPSRPRDAGDADAR